MTLNKMLIRCSLALHRSVLHGFHCGLNTPATLRHERKELYSILEKRRELSSKQCSSNNDNINSGQNHIPESNIPESNIGEGNIPERNLSKGNPHRQLATRKELLESLQNDQFDVLVVGGGAIGCGCALDAASRGLKTALIETGDFGCGASCKTNKLLEGTNSFMRAAVQGADMEQMYMLQQMMDERAILMRIAPHLTRLQPMMIPIYKPLELPFYWLGLKLYDVMAGMANVRGSHFLSKEDTLNELPLLRQDGLLGSLVYYDGKLDDARMCLALAVTALKHGATVANYVELKGIAGKGAEEEKGYRNVLVEDKIEPHTFSISSKCIINATGQSTDVIRKLDNCEAKEILLPTTSTHITLSSYFGSGQYGLLFPRRQQLQGNSEAMIMVPYENHLVMGSIDARHDQKLGIPSPKGQSVNCLLNELRGILESYVRLRSDHVLSAWTGIKNRVIYPKSDKEKGTGSEIIPNFLLEVSENGLITLAGGRWSIYRTMASEAIDTAVEEFSLTPKVDRSCTQNLLLDGAENYYCLLPVDLVQRYNLHRDIAQHLSETYGSNALQLLESSLPSSRKRLHPKFPYIAAEVEYASQREYACNLVDVIARRMRGAFVDVLATHQMLPAVLQIMAREKKDWTKDEQIEQFKNAVRFLISEMGLGTVVQTELDVRGMAGPEEKDKSEVLLNMTPINLKEIKKRLSTAQTEIQISANIRDPGTEGAGSDVQNPSKATRGSTYQISENGDISKKPKKPAESIGFKPVPDKNKPKPKKNKSTKASLICANSTGICKVFHIKAKGGNTISGPKGKREPSLGHMIVKDRESVESGKSLLNMPGFGTSTPKQDNEKSVGKRNKSDAKKSPRDAWPSYKLSMKMRQDKDCLICSRSQALNRRITRSTFSNTNNIREYSQQCHLQGCQPTRSITLGFCATTRDTDKLESDGSPSELARAAGEEATSLSNDLKALGVSEVNIYAICYNDGNKSYITKGYIELTVKRESLEKLSRELADLEPSQVVAPTAEPTIRTSLQKEEKVPHVSQTEEPKIHV